MRTHYADTTAGERQLLVRLPASQVSGGGVSGDASAANQAISNSLLGDVVETAPATDTGSSGINGRLQRAAQRLTSLIALLPAALGAGGGLKVDGSGTALPISASALPLPTGAATSASQATLATYLATAATYVNASGTITTGGTAQTASAADTARRGLFLQNNSTTDLWFSTLATAVASQPSIKIAAGQSFSATGSDAPTGAVSIIGATTGQAFSGRVW